MVERKHRVEDALEAVSAAQEEGIIVGGGTALLISAYNCQINTENEYQDTGVKILLSAIEAPLRQMAKNAGKSPDIICNLVQESIKSGDNLGYNFMTEKMEDLLESGVIDPVKVTRMALQNAASVAGTLITTNYSIIEG